MPTPLITRLSFKNWRSLRDVTIDNLTPITVFIGTNSSGKTNILDGIRFYRDILQKGLVSVVMELGYTNIQTDAPHQEGPVELEATYNIPEKSSEPVKETHILQFDKRDLPFQYQQILYEGERELEKTEEELPIKDVIRSHPIDDISRFQRSRELRTYLHELKLKRWQLLGDNFVPATRLSSREGGSPYVMEPDARNMLFMLNFLREGYPELFEQLQDDLGWMLDHVSDLSVSQQTEDYSLKLLVREKEERTAPTVSSGTARLLAMLTAVYALEMPQRLAASGILSAAAPGLIVIEEPDTALNPGILEKFVEQIRTYAEGEHPRQFIMTTHNPRFLDYFKPEEVRVVTRSADGYTIVEPVPDDISEIWLKDHGLGEVWMTRSLGGMPE